ncbi:MAG: ACT domain-containing protein [Desulfobacterales bacterium]|nr:ACT domain-containing protein [Desulfobacterales bacterium]MDJ0888105.1 ACT domain-containing protein [Desulfobacterales bacterium]MDJ0989273.1 ACT domain-containing protein [Desulfobacterales bacterium]
MKKIIISVLGQDRPGIIAAIARILFENDGNIENVSQTSLQSEFAGIFIVAIPDILAQADLEQRMAAALDGMDLQVHIKPVEPRHEAREPVSVESFIITTRGPDQKGLVARVTEVIARHNVNVTNCQAVFKGGDDPNSNIMIYEVDIPPETDQQTLFSDLRHKGAELNLQVSIQHRDIFETLNRI